MDLDLDNILNIQRCEFCGNVVSDSQGCYVYADNGQAKIAHTSCPGVKEFVDNWGLLLRLQNIPMLLGD